MSRRRELHLPGFRLWHGLLVMLVLAFVTIQTTAQAAQRSATASAEDERLGAAHGPLERCETGDANRFYDLDASEPEGEDDNGLADAFLVSALADDLCVAVVDPVVLRSRRLSHPVDASISVGLARGPPLPFP